MTLSKVKVGITDCTLVNSQQLAESCEADLSEAGQQSLASPKLTEVRPLKVQVIRDSFGAKAVNNSSAASGNTVNLLFRMKDNFHMFYAYKIRFQRTVRSCKFLDPCRPRLRSASFKPKASGIRKHLTLVNIRHSKNTQY